jgi:hypothetical protein
MQLAGRKPHPLLENGDNYYPALFAAIARAQRK